MRVATPTKNCYGVDGFDGRYTTKSGFFDMSKRDAKALVEIGGFVPSLSGSTRSRLGFRCPSCGFGSYLRSCGRCGGECEREGVVPAADAAPAAGAAQTGEAS